MLHVHLGQRVVIMLYSLLMLRVRLGQSVVIMLYIY